MEKITKIFEDGEVTKYTFANGNYITIINMILPFGKYSGNIGWSFGTYKNELYGKPLPLNIYNTKNQAKLEEAKELYHSIKKHKDKSQDKKLLLQALMIIIHDIKNEIFVEQNLF